MKFWLDSEFFEQGGRGPQLISIGIVAQDDRRYYAQAVEFSWGGVPVGSGCNGIPMAPEHWLRLHVLPYLKQCPSGFGRRAHESLDSGRCLTPDCPWVDRRQLAADLAAFMGDAPELIGWCCDYDYVLLSQAFGGMEKWPAGWPFYMQDIQQIADETGFHLPDAPAAHEALGDALHIRHCWDLLTDMRQIVEKT